MPVCRFCECLHDYSLRNKKMEERMALKQKIQACLWFDSEAEEAAKFYTSIFKDSKMGKIGRYGKEGYEVHHQPEGKVMVAEFEIEGQKFTALNGGPLFKLNEAISFQIFCDTQEEIDYYWSRLTEGGDPRAQQCGWLKDKFGLSWQVVPSIMGELFGSGVNEKTERAMKAVMGMKKIDLAQLKRAYEGK